MCKRERGGVWGREKHRERERERVCVVVLARGVLVSGVPAGVCPAGMSDMYTHTHTHTHRHVPEQEAQVEAERGPSGIISQIH